MGAAHPRRHWTDFAELVESPGAGGGFMLAVPCDTLLRKISEPYLRTAWQRVAVVLERYQLAPADLSWGRLTKETSMPRASRPRTRQLRGLGQSAPCPL